MASGASWQAGPARPDTTQVTTHTGFLPSDASVQTRRLITLLTLRGSTSSRLCWTKEICMDFYFRLLLMSMFSLAVWMWRNQSSMPWLPIMPWTTYRCNLDGIHYDTLCPCSGSEEDNCVLFPLKNLKAIQLSLASTFDWTYHRWDRLFLILDVHTILCQASWEQQAR